MLRRVATIMLAALFSGLALGQSQTTWLYQHNPYYEDPNVPGYPCYEKDQYLLSVTINHAEPNEPFQFESVRWAGDDPPIDPYDPNAPWLGPGNINSIIADPNSGPVTVEVVADINALHNTTLDAVYVGLLDLDAPGVDGKLGNFKINCLGLDADTHVGTIAGNVEALTLEQALCVTNVTGTFYADYIGASTPVVLGNVVGSFSAGDPYLPWGNIRSPVTIGTLAGSFRANMVRPGSNLSVDLLSGPAVWLVTR
jgi:hypothetical protein